MSDEETKTTDLYSVLGLTSDATLDEIKTAFKKLSKLYHPDTSEDTEENKARFHQIMFAYQILKDPESRAHYDETGKAEQVTSKMEEEERVMFGAAVEAYQEAIQGLLKAGNFEKFKRIDLIKMAKAILKREKKGLLDQVEAYKQSIEISNEQIKRLRFKGKGFNPILRYLENDIRDDQRSIVKLQEGADFRDKVIEFLDEYKYLIDTDYWSHGSSSTQETYLEEGQVLQLTTSNVEASNEETDEDEDDWDEDWEDA